MGLLGSRFAEEIRERQIQVRRDNNGSPWFAICSKKTGNRNRDSISVVSSDYSLSPFAHLLSQIYYPASHVLLLLKSSQKNHSARLIFLETFKG
ncbi:hypothetical protein L1887_02854 [Cichorium endivia]|nr:hypothetical protein L1887_02854 [Cichorium endivia]